MKRLLLAFTLVVTIFLSLSIFATPVSAYYVNGYYRSRPNAYTYDNYSYTGPSYSNGYGYNNSYYSGYSYSSNWYTPSYYDNDWYYEDAWSDSYSERDSYYGW